VNFLDKNEVFHKELSKLQNIFQKVEPDKADMVQGLIEDAAFLKSENYELRKKLAITGMIKFHPTNPELQKPVEASKQYLKNVNAYAVVIKTLNGVLMKSIIEDDDEFEKFIRENSGSSD